MRSTLVVPADVLGHVDHGGEVGAAVAHRDVGRVQCPQRVGFDSTQINATEQVGERLVPWAAPALAGAGLGALCLNVHAPHERADVLASQGVLRDPRRDRCVTQEQAQEIASKCSLDATKWNRGLCGAPLTVSAIRSATAGAWSRQRSRRRLAAAIGRRGLLLGWAACVPPLALQPTPSGNAPSAASAFGVRYLADSGIFSRTKCLTCSLDSTSLHRGYVGCAATLADSLLAAISARVAGSCSPRVSWLFSLIGAACTATFTSGRRLRVACTLAMSIDAHTTH